MNLSLALDVSWRGITGPLSTIRLIDYGDDAIETAQALGMVIEDDKAHLSARTPDLAERALQAAEETAKRDTVAQGAT